MCILALTIATVQNDFASIQLRLMRGVRQRSNVMQDLPA
jgi:hypothetical protein